MTSRAIIISDAISNRDPSPRCRVITSLAMCVINPPPFNQPTFLCTFVAPAFSLLPLLALLILAMKRKRPSTTSPDPESKGSSAWDACDGSTLGKGKRRARSPSSGKGKGRARSPTWEVPAEESPPQRKRRKAIPQHMRHMRDNMTVWGARWMPATQPSTAGSQQGEIDASGNYTVSKSPPPAYRMTPSISPVVVTASSSSPTTHHLSSKFETGDHGTPLLIPPRSPSPSLSEMFPFSDTFGEELFGQFSNALKAEPSSIPFTEDLSAFDFDAKSSFTFSNHLQPSHNMTQITSSTHPSASFPQPSDPLTNSMALMDLYSGGPLPSVPSNFDNSRVAYPFHGASDWLPPPPTQHSLPVNNVAHYPDGLYHSPLSFSSPPYNVSDFPTTAWTTSSQRGETCHPISSVGGYSTAPMYTAHGSPYLGVPDGHYSPIYHRSGSGSPLALYPGPCPQYCPHPPLSPLSTRTASSGSLTSLFAPIDNNSPNSIESMIFSRARGMSGSDYGDYNYSSPHSGVFTGSPSSVSSAHGGLEGSYPRLEGSYPRLEGSYPNSSTSQTVPLPFNPPPPYPSGNFTFSFPS
ncbi:hypothetical protein C8F04DRAFT_391234 [Mycena alexandri]|uniref:Uncharacterized protein n=1 Tax=Mycena alexandri TaxID=1745969 RepID=A0AAD6WNZ3_9AGAR|nr:hypothetical protein C8F04DRAFT_391234 [Mycena alexandri]